MFGTPFAKNISKKIMNKVICIMGPTGSGKTAQSLVMAKAGLPVCIINADSRQLYKDFPIISAQPDTEEKALCPHMLFGYLETKEASSAGDWLEKAKNEIELAHARGQIPVLVGGTGFYFRALFDGIVKIPNIPQDIHTHFIQEIQKKGSRALYAELQKTDREYAEKIHFNDKQRIARALEVFAATGKKFSEWHKETPKNTEYDVLRIGIGLPLSELTPFLYKRTALMLENGAMEEAKTALEHCPDIAAPGWSGIGCIELANYLLGKHSLEECKTLWNKNTRAYAKRQWTWFRADPRIHWFRPEEQSLPAILDFLNA